MKRVLILDDEKEILELWHWHFKSWGEKVELHTALDGAKGIEKLKEVGKFDLIITDFKMPEIDGLDFISYVRLTDKETPIFLFSGYIAELTFLADRLPNVMFFEKPFIGDKLRTYVRMCLHEERLPAEAL